MNWATIIQGLTPYGAFMSPKPTESCNQVRQHKLSPPTKWAI